MTLRLQVATAKLHKNDGKKNLLLLLSCVQILFFVFFLFPFICTTIFIRADETFKNVEFYDNFSTCARKN